MLGNMLGPPGTDDFKVKCSKHVTEEYLYFYDEQQLLISFIKIQGIG